MCKHVARMRCTGLSSRRHKCKHTPRNVCSCTSCRSLMTATLSVCRHCGASGSHCLPTLQPATPRSWQRLPRIRCVGHGGREALSMLWQRRKGAWSGVGAAQEESLVSSQGAGRKIGWELALGRRDPHWGRQVESLRGACVVPVWCLHGACVGPEK